MKKLIFFFFILALFWPNSAWAVDCDLAVQINVNTASKEELGCIVHIGPSRADSIIETRPFNSLEELAGNISGIGGPGSATFTAIEDQGLVVFDGETVFDEEEIENGESDEESQEEQEEDQDSNDTSAHSDPTPLSENEPEIAFGLSAGRDRTVLVNTPIQFRAEVFDMENVSVSQLNFSWSFGDGYGGRRENTRHTYDYPGEYVVVVSAEYQDAKAVARSRVLVVENNLELNFSGDLIEIKNKGEKEVNIGNFVLNSESNNFRLAVDTILLPGRSIKFSAKEIGFLPDENISLEVSGQIMAQTSSQISVEEVSDIVESVEELITAFSQPDADTSVVVEEVDREVVAQTSLQSSVEEVENEEFEPPIRAQVIEVVEQVDRPDSVLNRVLNMPRNLIRGIFDVF